MLAIDPETGAVYLEDDDDDDDDLLDGFEEDPEDLEVGEIIYDGLGNPIGILPALAPLVAALAPKVIAMVAPMVVKQMMRRARRR